MRKVLLGVLLVLAGMVANAEQMNDRWAYLGSTRDGDDLFYDPQTYNHGSQVWIKTLFARQNSHGATNRHRYDEDMTLYAADCQNRRLAVVSSASYWRGRAVEHTESSYLQYFSVKPDTIGEYVYILICGRTR